MSTSPTLATRDRVIDAVLVVSCGIAQAAALAVCAFATRDAFAALHTGGGLAIHTMLALAAAGIVAAICLLLSRRRAESLGQSYAIALRHALYKQIARLPKSRHDERRVGALSLRFVGDLSAARLWFGRGLPDVLSASVVLPAAVAILFALDPTLATAGLIPLGAALVVMVLAAWHLERRHRKLRHRRASIAIAMIERIAIAPDLDLMGRTSRELRALDGQGASLRDDAVARRGRTAGLQAILQIGVALSGLTMLWLASRNGIAPATVAASLSVLALIAMPMQDLGSAWDKYCAWRVAREKAQRLLNEPVMRRRSRSKAGPVSVTLTGMYRGKPVKVDANRGEVTKLTGASSHTLARLIAGLDASNSVDVRFDGQAQRPRIAHIGDDHLGLQGSLRRSATLMSRKRPTDKRIAQTLTAFGLETLLSAPQGLDQRMSENGKGLTAAQSLRLELARVVLGKCDVIVIASSRWSAEPDQNSLIETLRGMTPATIIIAQTAVSSTIALDNEKAL
ncbi:ABC transporter ATP-binding protein/permease [Yoonia sp. F2084L]|uniref:ABC transporter transmembrane domain-containing protein n=1 Tax=Yoonia sp. F2084L TaxID=2926419 RepID=UPI001FF1CFDD|nr:ABC transporter ATP-binding protein [Yoonia sp. F2084L]MCK0096942.1 ABC transporter ATP-binding protein/permease [Yoonia sp. F2084L]